MRLKCLNCHYLFESDDYSPCPRCSSKKLERAPALQDEGKKDAGGETDKDGVKTQFPRVQRPPIIMGDTKNAWQSFHSSTSTSCPKCGGKTFTTDFKHKEKTCKSCGELVSIRRHLT